ncbi:MAG: LysR family transcriptional regulator [Firmicutes bacterium]|nr:LysR family transcriptional regulator [Bacillota bacterium]
MDFRQIEAFVHVVRLKSFSKAGEAMYLTQPTISAHINSLENELGIKLLDRSNKEIIPTKAGRIFFDYAVNLINTRDNAIFRLSEYSSKMEGKIEIAVSTIPGQYLLPGVIKDFHEKYHNIRFSILQFDSREVIKELLDGRVEIGIVGSRVENDKLIYDFLTEDQLVLITPNNDRYADINSRTLPFEYIARENFIFREPGSGTRLEFERALKQKGIDPKSLNVIVQMSSPEAIKHSVSIGLGISVVSLLSIKDYLKFRQIRVFDIEGLNLRRAFYFVHHKNRPISPITQAFKDFTLKYYKSKVIP